MNKFVQVTTIVSVQAWRSATVLGEIQYMFFAGMPMLTTVFGHLQIVSTCIPIAGRKRSRTALLVEFKFINSALCEGSSGSCTPSHLLSSER